MTQVKVIQYQHKDVVFFVREEQRDALNEALAAKELSKKYGFTPHALRHAYNIRGNQLGINQKMLADSLGHRLQMNSTTYLKHQSEKSKLST